MSDLKNFSKDQLLAELTKRDRAVDDSKKVKKPSAEIIEPQWVGKFAHELPDQSQRAKFAQYSTPPHIAESMVKILTDSSSLKDQIIYEPFVGAGAMFLPLRNQGAVLIGSDIDLEALEICNQLVPEAILIHHNSFGCLEPNRNIAHFQKKIEKLRNKSKPTAQTETEIVRWTERIAAEK